MGIEKRALVIIDPQNCFMDFYASPLPVTGASADMRRLTNHLNQFGELYQRIYISLDTHPRDHISFANRWIDPDGNHPPPFTIITHKDYKSGRWQAANEADKKWQGEYLRRLHRQHYIWPDHGEKGSWEWQMIVALRKLLSPGVESETRAHLFDRCVFIEKGMHRDVEQFGIFGAEVPYPDAPETSINEPLIEELRSYDEIDWAGEAASHCFMDSVNQFLERISFAEWRKNRLLQNCTSPVPQAPGGPDFPRMTEEWFVTLQSHGVKMVNV